MIFSNASALSWASMTTNEFGKFCSHCSKNVIDFTKLSDNEVLKIIENTEGKLCGRLNKSQLNKFLVKTEVNNPIRFIYSKILAGFLLFTAANKSEAKGAPIVENVAQINNLTTAHSNLLEQHTALAGSTNLIKGRVIDPAYKGEADELPNVTVRMKGTKFDVITDSHGKFQFIVPDSLLTEKLEFVVFSIGYTTTSFTVYQKDLPLTQDIAIKQEQGLVGAISSDVKIQVKKNGSRKRLKKAAFNKT